MKLLIRIVVIVIFGAVFNTEASFAFQNGVAQKSSQQQEVKQVETSGVNAAFLEHSRILFSGHSETAPNSAPALFTFGIVIGFTRIFSDNIYQKKLKMLRQRWLWLILFPFHSFD
jgi:hypothetical protein